MFDLVIRHGTIIDGTRQPRFTADVGIRGDRIESIGELSDVQTRETIDAAGRIVAPGFIDVHNHSDGWLLKTPHLTPKTTQGFTTEILMADGISYAPVNEHTAREWLFYLRSLDGLRVDEYRGWRSLGEFMACLDGHNVQNAATHVPYANVRSLFCGFGQRVVDDLQMRQIKAEIERGLADGAVGLSTGLDYIAQCYASTDELVEACRVLADCNGVYVTHVRYKLGILRGIQEAVEIARRAGIRLHISHIKGQSPELVEQLLDYIDRTARHEVDFSMDVYPYQAGSTMLNYLLPYDAWDDGPLAALARMATPERLTRYRAGLDVYPLDLNHIYIAWLPGRENQVHLGRTLREYVAQTGRSAEEALLDLLIEERLAVLSVFNEGNDELIRPLLAHDLAMIGSDGIYFPEGAVHPRVYGTATRLLGPCVRELKLVSLEEAVHKLAGFAASRFQLSGRGTLQVGNSADVVIFDPDTITDRATYDRPHQTSVGIEHVLVNGVPILRNGTPLDSIGEALPGRFVRRREARSS